MRKIKRMMFIFLFISVFLITSVQSSVPADGYGCLDNKIKNRGCNLLSTEEKVFSVLSTGECEEELLKNSEKNNSCWSRPGNTCDVKLTSQAYLALDEQGGVNEKIVKWISSKNKTADDIQWYLQINAPRNTNCSINTSSDNDYKIQIKNKEKIKEKSISPGSSPFSVSSEGYSIRIDKNYYNKDFSVSCDENFKASFLFEYDNSIYVSDITKFGSKNSPLELKVKSLSFNNYEETLWASIALRKGGKSISPFLPYLIVKEKENSEYIP